MCPGTFARKETHCIMVNLLYLISNSIVALNKQWAVSVSLRGNPLPLNYCSPNMQIIIQLYIWLIYFLSKSAAVSRTKGFFCHFSNKLICGNNEINTFQSSCTVPRISQNHQDFAVLQMFYLPPWGSSWRSCLELSGLLTELGWSRRILGLEMILGSV